DQQGHGVDAQFLRGKQQDRHQGDTQYQCNFDCHACFPQARQLTIACSLRNRGGKNDKAEHELGFVQIGAQEKTRTSTAVRPLAPEASVSTNFTTWAGTAVETEQVQSPCIGAQEKTRTSTAVKPLAPEASVSTNFTTWACLSYISAMLILSVPRCNDVLLTARMIRSRQNLVNPCLQK